MSDGGAPSGDELHFLGSLLLLHGETREMKPATARRRGRPNDLRP